MDTTPDMQWWLKQMRESGISQEFSAADMTRMDHVFNAIPDAVDVIISWMHEDYTKKLLQALQGNSVADTIKGIWNQEVISSQTGHRLHSEDSE